jgi:hypothetical protein
VETDGNVLFQSLSVTLNVRYLRKKGHGHNVICR